MLVRAGPGISGPGLRSATASGEVLGDVRIHCGSLFDIRLAAGGIALLHFRDPTAIQRFGPVGLEPQRRIVVCDPAPIPLDEMQRTYDWLRSWGMLEETASPLQLVNLGVQERAHVVAQ